MLGKVWSETYIKRVSEEDRASLPLGSVILSKRQRAQHGYANVAALVQVAHLRKDSHRPLQNQCPTPVMLEGIRTGCQQKSWRDQGIGIDPSFRRNFLELFRLPAEL